MAEPRGKILVVDDEPNMVLLLAEYLTEQGYQVVTAHGGIEALAKLDLEKPQAILLDVRMPAWTESRSCAESGASTRRWAS